MSPVRSTSRPQVHAGTSSSSSRIPRGLPGVAAQELRAGDRRRDIGNDTREPASHLISEQHETTKPAGSDRALPHDASVSLPPHPGRGSSQSRSDRRRDGPPRRRGAHRTHVFTLAACSESRRLCDVRDSPTPCSGGCWSGATIALSASVHPRMLEHLAGRLGWSSPRVSRRWLGRVLGSLVPCAGDCEPCVGIGSRATMGKP